MQLSPRAAQTLRKRILVVEDDTEILEAVTALLDEEGYQVEGVRDGKEALTRLRLRPPPDLIVLDLMMPVMDGWEFRTVQRADPRVSAIPVLAMSADASAKAAAIDAAHFLRKPFESRQLVQTVDKIFRDAELRRMRDRLGEAERLASLGALAAGAAHEISNPITFTIANLGAMHEQLTNARALVHRLGAVPLAAPESEIVGDLLATMQDMDDLLRDGRTGADRVSRVVRNLQSISRRQEDPHKPVDLVRVLESSIAITFNQIRHRAGLVRDFSPVASVVANEWRLGQLFVNLLVNAAQAIPEGNAHANEIRVTLRQVADGAVIEVKDTGEGIAPETRDRLFEPFFTTKPAGVGTGLGLSICQSVVTEHHGRIEVESDRGRGSTFRVFLPAEPRAAAPLAAKERPTSVQQAPLRRGRVLVIDDEPHLCWAMKRLLDREHDVAAVTHGREALDRLSAGERFDVILCDLTMPYLTGADVYKEIEERFPDVAPRVVFVSGGSLSESTDEFHRTMKNVCLMKPFEPEELKTVVRTFVQDGPPT